MGGKTQMLGLTRTEIGHIEKKKKKEEINNNNNKKRAVTPPSYSVPCLN